MISVCIAAYNGEKYIRLQLESILSQLGTDDEVIVSDDLSSDHTRDIISSLNDSRVRVIDNNGPHGPVGNFENALRAAKGDYIFLSDQDDVWLPDRVSRQIQALNENDTECVICNRIIIDGEGNTDGRPLRQSDFTRFPFYKVLWHNPYIGCCMAFTRKHLNLCLPFPDKLPMHDMWIGLIAHKLKRVKYISEPLIQYRRHGNNVTTGKSPYSIIKRISYRIVLLQQIKKRLKFTKK